MNTTLKHISFYLSCAVIITDVTALLENMDWTLLTGLLVRVALFAVFICIQAQVKGDVRSVYFLPFGVQDWGTPWITAVNNAYFAYFAFFVVIPLLFERGRKLVSMLHGGGNRQDRKLT